jgi:hypothetical protein
MCETKISRNVWRTMCHILNTAVQIYIFHFYGNKNKILYFVQTDYGFMQQNADYNIISLATTHIRKLLHASKLYETC